MSVRNAMLNALDIAMMELDNYKHLQLVKPMVSVQFRAWGKDYLYWSIDGLTVGDLVLVPIESKGKPPYQVAVVTRIWFYKPEGYDENRGYKTIFRKIPE